MTTTVRTTGRFISSPFDDPAEEQMVLQALGQHSFDAVGALWDQRRVGGICLRGAQRVPHLDHAPIDAPHSVDEKAEQTSHGTIDQEADGYRPHPGCLLVS